MNNARPSTTCDMCGARIYFDGFIRSPKGTCIPLNYNYSVHLCGNSGLTPQQVEQRTIRYLQLLVKKLGQGLPEYDVSLSIKAKLDGRPLNEPLTDADELVIASRPYGRF